MTHAAQPAPEPLIDVSTIQIRHLFTEQGLPDLAVWEVLQDSSGFIWVGTPNGLARYDGIEFLTFRHDPKNSNSLSGSSVRGLLQDRSGSLWIGTTGSGLNRYDPRTERFTRFEHDPQDPTSLSHQYVNIVYEDSSGTIWVGTYGGGLNRFNPDDESFTRYQHNPEAPTSLSHNDVFGILEDRDGVLWVATYGGGLNRFDRDSETFTHYRHDPDNPASLGSDTAYTLYEDRDGVLWVGTWGGLNRFNREDGTFTRYMADPNNSEALSSPNITDLLEDRDGNFWVGTWGGSLNRMDRATGVFTHYPAADGGPPLGNQFSQSRIRSIIQDREGLLWVGTESYGLNIADPYRKPFILHLNNPDDPYSLSGTTPRSIYQDDAGIIWIGTSNYGLYRYDRATGEVTNYRHDPADPASLASNVVFDIDEDEQGRLWLGTVNGASRLDPATGIFTSYRHEPGNSNSLVEDHVHSLLVDRDGLVWLATYGGISVLNPETETFTHYRHDPADPTTLTSNVMVDIYQDQTGAIWASTEGNGLNRFQADTGTFVRYDHDPTDPTSLSDNTVVKMNEDADGNLWLATWAGGLNRYDRENDRFTRYGIEFGLPERILCVVGADDGLLWFNDSNVWGSFDPQARTTTTYDYRDGLPTRGGVHNSCLVDDTNEVIFGIANGLMTFYPEEIVPNDFIPPVVFTDFRLEREPVLIEPGGVLDQTLNFSDGLTLARDIRTLTFEFAALSYRHAASNRYRYMLEGFDTDWYETGSDRRSVTYSNLLPGDYTLRVLGSNNDGVWNEIGRSVSVTILPAWWEADAFRLLVVGLLAAAGIGAYRLRTEMYRRRTRELEAQVARRTAEISTLLEVSRTATVTHELDSLLRLILDQLHKIVKYDAAGILEKVDGNLVLQAVTGRLPDTLRLPYTIPLGRLSALQPLITQGDVLYIPDFTASTPAEQQTCTELLNATREDLRYSVGSVMGVPLIHQGKTLGALLVISRTTAAYTVHEQTLALAFATQMAYAIINARLYEQTQQAATQAERQRLNRELHDSLSQTLFASKMALNSMPRLLDKSVEKSRARLAELNDLINRADDELRELLSDTRSERLKRRSLTALIQELGENYRQQTTGEVRLRLQDLPVLAPEVQSAYYYIAQEALHNSVKHAGATITTVELTLYASQLTLHISDDGAGFDPSFQKVGHYGLTIMRERAETIGAQFYMTSQPGAGTHLEITCGMPEMTTLSREAAINDR